MSSVPPPMRLVPLSELGLLPSGTKVRFLGCVLAYSIETGHLYLEVPTTDTESTRSSPESVSKKSIIEVDTAIVREDLGSIDTAIGTWLNVSGYVQSNKEVKKVQGSPKMAGEQTNKLALRYKPLLDSKYVVQQVRFQAILIWNAGAVDANLYSVALSARSRLFNTIVI